MNRKKNEHGMYVLTIWDVDELHFVIEDVIVGLRYNRYYFDDEGNYIMDQVSEEEKHVIFEKCVSNGKTDYLNFRENPELRQISFHDAVYMPLQEIKEKYLKDVLPVARGILRKDTSAFGDFFVVSEEVPDSYLDDLLALRWRENLKLWTMQWEHEEARKEENQQAEQAECINALIERLVACDAARDDGDLDRRISLLDVKRALRLDRYRVEMVSLENGQDAPQLVLKDSE